MSLNIRYLTNGEKEVFTVSNIGVTPPTFEIFEKREDIDKNIRHYAPKEPKYCDPDIAQMFDVLDIFYPNQPNCVVPKWKNTICIENSCRHWDIESKKCDYPVDHEEEN